MFVCLIYVCVYVSLCVIFRLNGEGGREGGREGGGGIEGLSVRRREGEGGDVEIK